VQDPEDEKLQEFLEVTQPRGKAATWSNEDTVLAQAQKKAEKVDFGGWRDGDGEAVQPYDGDGDDSCAGARAEG
jgi:hypothetical protein